MNQDRSVMVSAKYLELLATAIRHVESHQRTDGHERPERVYVMATPHDLADLLNSLKDHLKEYRCETLLRDLISEELWMQNNS